VDEVTIRVVAGDPTPEELAALVTALVGSAARASSAPPVSPPSRWAASARPRGHGIGVPAPDAWRASALPSRP
jgi:hypothetical protein